MNWKAIAAMGAVIMLVATVDPKLGMGAVTLLAVIALMTHPEAFEFLGRIT